MSYKDDLFNEARAQQEKCRDWLKQFMRPGQPKPMTKEELFQLAKEQLNISRSSFDMAWVWAIEQMDRQDWYRPLPRRKTPTA